MHAAIHEKLYLPPQVSVRSWSRGLHKYSMLCQTRRQWAQTFFRQPTQNLNRFFCRICAFQWNETGFLAMTISFSHSSTASQAKYLTPSIKQIDHSLSAFCHINIWLEEFFFIFTIQNSRQGAIRTINSNNIFFKGLSNPCHTTPVLK